MQITLAILANCLTTYFIALWNQPPWPDFRKHLCKQNLLSTEKVCSTETGSQTTLYWFTLLLPLAPHSVEKFAKQRFLLTALGNLALDDSLDIKWGLLLSNPRVDVKLLISNCSLFSVVAYNCWKNKNKTLTERLTPNANLYYLFLTKCDISVVNISRDVFCYHHH